MFGMGSNLPFIAGGGRFSANEVTLDGVDNNTVSNAGSHREERHRRRAVGGRGGGVQGQNE